MTAKYFRAAFLAMMIAAGVSPAPAQTRDQLIDAFSGEWYIFDPEMAAGDSPCKLTLGKTGAGLDGLPAASLSGCAPSMFQVAFWNIEGAVLRLFDGPREMQAELGGSQRRMSGIVAATGKGLIIERSDGDGSSREIASAVQRHRCYFVGLTSVCATADDLALPTFADGPDGLAEIETLANLKARSEPRRDAPVAGTIAQGTCIRANQCLTASDGIWCRARFGETSVWLSKVVIRQSEWAVTTFRNGCTAAAR